MRNSSTASKTPSPIQVFSGQLTALGPTPAVWSTDHENISNNANNSQAVTAGTSGPDYVVRFPYKISSDSPVVNNILYLTSGNISGRSHPAAGTLWAINPSSGHILWQQGLPNSAFAEPIISHGRVYVGVGNIIFPHSPGQPHTTRGTGTSGIWVFSARTGLALWHYETSGSDQPPVTVSHGVAYLASGNRKLYALNAGTGQHLWSASLHSYVSRSGPRIVGHMLSVARMVTRWMHSI
jgi:outer membrane protein assembly factor BamB